MTHRVRCSLIAVVCATLLTCIVLILLSIVGWGGKNDGEISSTAHAVTIGEIGDGYPQGQTSGTCPLCGRELSSTHVYYPIDSELKLAQVFHNCGSDSVRLSGCYQVTGSFISKSVSTVTWGFTPAIAEDAAHPFRGQFDFGNITIDESGRTSPMGLIVNAASAKIMRLNISTYSWGWALGGGTYLSTEVQNVTASITHDSVQTGSVRDANGGLLYRNGSDLSTGGVIANCRVSIWDNIETYSGYGGLAHDNYGTVDHCHVEFQGANSGIIKVKKEFGGLLVHNYGYVFNSSANFTRPVDITAGHRIGGLLAEQWGIKDPVKTGAIDRYGNPVQYQVYNCKATFKTMKTQNPSFADGGLTVCGWIGGLIGFIADTNPSYIRNCQVVGEEMRFDGRNSGGFVGFPNGEETITDCDVYFSVGISGYADMGGFTGGTLDTSPKQRKISLYGCTVVAKKVEATHYAGPFIAAWRSHSYVIKDCAAYVDSFIVSSHANVAGLLVTSSSDKQTLEIEDFTLYIKTISSALQNGMPADIIGPTSSKVVLKNIEYTPKKGVATGALSNAESSVTNLNALSGDALNNAYNTVDQKLAAGASPDTVVTPKQYITTKQGEIDILLEFDPNVLNGYSIDSMYLTLMSGADGSFTQLAHEGKFLADLNLTDAGLGIGTTYTVSSSAKGFTVRYLADAQYSYAGMRIVLKKGDQTKTVIVTQNRIQIL